MCEVYVPNDSEDQLVVDNTGPKRDVLDDQNFELETPELSQKYAFFKPWTLKFRRLPYDLFEFQHPVFKGKAC